MGHLCRRKSSNGTSKEDTQNRKVDEYVVLQRTDYSCLTLGVANLKQSRVWQLVLCSHRAHEDTRLSKKTARIFRHEKGCHEEDGACSWTKYKNAKHEKHVSPYKWKLTNSTDKRLRYMLGPSHPGRLLHAILSKSLSKTKR